ncbi:Disease resistance protein RPM1 [Acorus calamus]|uniref:Disease resistance protein RPM1 n=1 Tax=Acorus calamus TaxID=4465 RepID=A0AAV9EX38_ACOCL|nr:Disease resistance protein RPM1 [Acorus calamus]
MVETVFVLLAVKIASATTATLLSSLIRNEAKLLTSIKNDWNFIKCELQVIQTIVKKVYQGDMVDDLAETWVNQMREIACKIEDILDEFTYVAQESKRLSLVSWHDVAGKLKNVKNEVVQSGKRGKRYDIKVTDGEFNFDNINVPGMENGEETRNLMRGYHGLSHWLKICFLYCSVFPEHHHIKKRRIVRLWIAEGFVEEKEGAVMEDTAEEYLGRLVREGMLRVMRENRCGRPKEYCMCDGARRVALILSSYQNLLTMYRTSSDASNTRRISITENNNVLQKLLSGNNTTSPLRSLRSLLVFTNYDSVFTTLETMGKSCFKFLGVLDLQGSSIESVPDAVKNLFNLRYLGLRETNVSELPKSLGKLHNLQTLDIQYTNIQKLPEGIKLPSLRHLFIIRSGGENGLYEGIEIPKKMWKKMRTPGDVLTLRGIIADDKVVRNVGNLTKLRSFAILEVRECDGQELCASIKKMSSLHHLYVQAADKGEGNLELQSVYPLPSEVSSGSEPRPPLQKLSLKGNLRTPPQWFGSLENLKELHLRSSGLKTDPLQSLQSLPNLLHLSLFKAYLGVVLHFRANRFPSLKHIRLCELSMLNQIEIEETTMPKLQKLSLVRCKNLKALPQDIGRLTTLKQLYLQEMPGVLLESIRGVDCMKISHVSVVVHAVHVDGELDLETLKE